MCFSKIRNPTRMLFFPPGSEPKENFFFFFFSKNQSQTQLRTISVRSSSSRGRHRGTAEQHRGPDRMQASGRLPLLVPHPERAEAGHPRVGTCTTECSRLFFLSRPNPGVRVCVVPQADGQHVPVQPLPLRGAAGRGDGGRRLPAEEGDAALPAAHLLLPHGPQPVHGAGAHRGSPHVRELLPLPRRCPPRSFAYAVVKCLDLKMPFTEAF